MPASPAGSAVIPAGIIAVGLFMAVVLLALVAADILLEANRAETIGARLAVWANRYPLAAIALATVLGALLGHFFW